MTNRATGWAAQKDQYAVPVMFNPYTGEPRDVRAVQSVPQGILIAPPGRVEMLAATPPAQAEDSVLEDAARYQWLADYLIGDRTDLDDTIVACVSEKELSEVIDAAHKQGANHD